MAAVIEIKRTEVDGIFDGVAAGRSMKLQVIDIKTADGNVQALVPVGHGTGKAIVPDGDPLWWLFEPGQTSYMIENSRFFVEGTNGIWEQVPGSSRF